MFISIYSGVTGRLKFDSLWLPPEVLVDGDYYMVELGEDNERILEQVELNGPGVMVCLEYKDYYHRGKSYMWNGKKYLRWSKALEPEYKWRENGMEQMYMHPESGAVDTEAGWKADFEDYMERGALDEWGGHTWDARLIPVVQGADGQWVMGRLYN